MLSIEKQILFLLSRVPSLETQEMIRIYEARDYSAQYVRNVLSKLKKDGYIRSSIRSTYESTEQGKHFIHSINQKPMFYQEEWDGTWFIVIVEVPESERKKRDRFRTDLLQLGFAALHKGVYISPWNFEQQIKQYIGLYGLQDNTSVISGTFVEHKITPELAENLWDLSEIHKLYVEKKVWFDRQFRPVVESLLKQKSNPLQIFLYYLQLGEVLGELGLSDPMLPELLVPTYWIGRSVFKDMQDCFVRLEKSIPVHSSYSKFFPHQP